VPDSVAQYYQSNSRFFLRFGEGGALGHIHRPVWGPGVDSLDEALCYVYGRVQEQLGELPTSRPRVIDLGCGVGAGLRYLKTQAMMTGVGITISGFQADKARELNEAEGARGLEVVCGDFSQWQVPQADAIYAVESLTHARDLTKVIGNVATSLPSGGRLVVCDDFLASGYAALPASERQVVNTIQEGWHLDALDTFESWDGICRGAGLRLVQFENWTPFLRVHRFRDKALAAMMKFGGHLPVKHSLWQSWKAGNALRDATQKGITNYCFGVWVKG